MGISNLPDRVGIAEPTATVASAYRALDDSRGIADVLGILGFGAWDQSDYEQARVYFEESVTLCRESGQTMGLWASFRLGYVALRQGDMARAGALLSEGLQRFKEVGSRIGVVYALEGLSSLAIAQGQPIRAISMFGWADAMPEIIANPRPPVDQADVDRDSASIRTQLGEAAAESAWKEGQIMPWSRRSPMPWKGALQMTGLLSKPLHRANSSAPRLSSIRIQHIRHRQLETTQQG
jgi:hypothetical protein